MTKSSTATTTTTTTARKASSTTLNREGGKAFAAQFQRDRKGAERLCKALMKALQTDFETAAALFTEEGEASHRFPSGVEAWLWGVQEGDVEAGVKAKDGAFRSAKQRITMALRRWCDHESYGLDGANVSIEVEVTDTGCEGTYTLSRPEPVYVPEDLQAALDRAVDLGYDVHHYEAGDLAKVLAQGLKNAKARKA